MPCRSWHAIIAACGLLAAVPAWGQPTTEPREIVGEPRPPDGARQGDHEAERNLRLPPPPVFSVESVPPQSGAADNQENCDEECQNDRADLAAQRGMESAAWAMVWATFASVACSAATMVLVWRTLVHTKKAAIAAGEAVLETAKAAQAAADSNISAEKMAKAAVEANRITLQAIDISSRSAEDASRPYVYASGARIYWDGDIVSVELEVRNVGQTPAINFGVVSEISVMESHCIDNLRLKINKSGIKYGAIGNIEPVKIGIHLKMESQKVEGVISSRGVKCFVCAGLIRYHDALGCEYESEYVFYSETVRIGSLEKMPRPPGERRTFDLVHDPRQADKA